MKRRTPKPALAPEAAVLLRAAFEPRYGRELGDGELDAMADRLRRFTAIVTGWEAEDRARATGADEVPPSHRRPGAA